MSSWRQQEYESKAKQDLSVYAVENPKGETMYTLNWQP
ncbi:DNA-3-methyladenine glycosylase 2, partial [Enterobacter hormaechei]|nr:DNA-3-methyladenine glycosylase 2 [Enterobacter hormaechei]